MVTSSQVVARRYPIYGADRVYSGMRWALLLIILAFSATNGSLGRLWPLPPETPFGWAIWGYVVFSFTATVLVILRNTGRIVPWLYGGDLLAVYLLALTSGTPPGTFELLFFLPLVAIAFRFPRRQMFLFCVISITMQTELLRHTGEVGLVSYVSRVVILLVLPFLISILGEQWTTDNRSSVQQADLRTMQALRDAEQYRERMRALYEVGATLSATPKAANVLSTALAEMIRILPYKAGVILLPTGERDEIAVAVSQGLRPAEQTVRFVVGQTVIGSILRGANGGVLPAEAKKQELASLPSIVACAATLVVPLRSGLRTYGLALFGLESAQPTAEQLEIATALMSYALVALQNAQLIEELHKDRASLLTREEEVRRQLNRDLHDGPAQALAAITMNLAFIKRLAQREPGRVMDELEKLAVIANRANHDVRTLLFELRPLVLETQGLLPTIRQYVERFKDEPTKITVEGDEAALKLSKRVQGTLFNIVQEAVTNALKHAKAEHLSIRLQPNGDHTVMTVQDDGQGFDLQAIRDNYDQRGSFGLLSIEERARLVDGTAELLSVPGAGTTVKVRMPSEV